MVTIQDFAVRNSSDGTAFVVLIIQGDLELVQSQDTGKFYATARTCTIPSTFDERTAALMVGREIPGTIIKESCDPYDYTIPETGEVVTLSHRYVYATNDVPAVSNKPQPKPLIQNLNPFDSNAIYADA